MVLSGYSSSSTTKTGRHDIAEILLKLAIKHQKSKIQIHIKPLNYCIIIITHGQVWLFIVIEVNVWHIICTIKVTFDKHDRWHPLFYYCPNTIELMVSAFHYFHLDAIYRRSSWVLNRIGGIMLSMLASSVVDCGLEPCVRLNPKTIKLVVIASPLSTQY